MQTTSTPVLGIPYATRHMDADGRLIAICPVCGVGISLHLRKGLGGEASGVEYQRHYETMHLHREKTMNLTLAKVKMAGGEETPRFEAELLLDGTRVAHVSNGGTGGANVYWWDLCAQNQARDNETIKAIEAYAKQETGSKFEALDAIVFRLLDEHDLSKRIARAVKKSTLFRLVGEKAGEYRSLNMAYSPQSREVLTTKFGAKLGCILNALPEGERAKRVMAAETGK